MSLLFEKLEQIFESILLPGFRNLGFHNSQAGIRRGLGLADGGSEVSTK
jgi:hypothetical protein